MMQFLLLALLVAAANGHSSSCKPKEVSDVEPLPPVSVARVTSAASEVLPSLSSDESIIAEITVNSPTFGPVETEIESYERSHYSTVSLLEYYAAYPSAVTSPTQEESLESKFPTLATAVNELVSAEQTHPSLADIQSSLQTLMVSYTTIVTAAATSFEFSHASLVTVESSISKIAITQPSIVTDVEVLTTIVSVSPSLESDLSELSYEAVSYSTALHEMTSARSWTSTTAWDIDTTLESIKECYSTLYTAITAIDSFLSSHSSDDEAFTNVVTALTYVPSIITDVSEFETSVSTSFTQALVSLSPIVQIDSHITTELTYVDVLAASHPSLSCAEGTLEREVSSHPTYVSEIEDAIASPSTVTDATLVDSLEDRYPSVVTAYDDVVSVEFSHPSFSYVQSELNYDEEIVSDVLTVANEVVSGTSPSLIGDEYALSEVEDVSPTVTVALHSLTVIEEASPSVSCAESVIAEYAATAGSVLYTIEEALQSPSSVSASSIAYIAKLTAEYESLADAIRTIISVESTFSSLETVQSDIDFALTYEPTLISVYNQITEYAAIATEEVCSFAPSLSSSS